MSVCRLLIYTIKGGFLKKQTLVFRAVLGSQQNLAEGTEIFHISLPPHMKDLF